MRLSNFLKVYDIIFLKNYHLTKSLFYPSIFEVDNLKFKEIFHKLFKRNDMFESFLISKFIISKNLKKKIGLKIKKKIDF